MARSFRTGGDVSVSACLFVLCLLATLLPCFDADTFHCPPEYNMDSSLSSNALDDTVWCLPTTYTMERPPFLDKRKEELNISSSLNLSFDFDIREISEVDDKAQSLALQMYFSMAWLEPRMIVNEQHSAWRENVTGPINEVTEDPKFLMRDFWVPDLEIYGLENFDSKNVLKEMSGLRIKKNKTIEFNARVSVVISCRMVFDTYPFDEHKCYFQVGSYYYLKDTVTCSSNFIQNPARQRNLQHTVTIEDLPDHQKEVQLLSGKYAACGFQVSLARKRNQLIYQIYLPCILFVFVSWVSFLIRPSVVPGRMALLVTLFLVLVNIFNNVRSSAPIPASSSLNAIDTYLVTAIFMIFFALLEYAVVLLAINLQDSKDVRQKKRCLKEALNKLPSRSSGSTANSTAAMMHSRQNGHEIQDILDEINANLVRTSPAKVLLQEHHYKLGPVSIRKIDIYSLVVFPLVFLIFNIGYWVHFAF